MDMELIQTGLQVWLAIEMWGHFKRRQEYRTYWRGWTTETPLRMKSGRFA